MAMLTSSTATNPLPYTFVTLSMSIVAIPQHTVALVVSR
jgi:hypothetical protein